MIPLDYITQWRSHAPWQRISQVEQDLIICRALVDLYSHPVVAANLEKLDDPRFLEDMGPLLTSSTAWDAKSAGLYVLEILAPLMPGETWQKTQEKLAVLKAV